MQYNILEKKRAEFEKVKNYLAEAVKIIRKM
jgi:hypothetical protein